MARPKKELDERQIFELAKLGCTYDEIALIMDVSRDTLMRRYQPLIHKGKAEMKISLRRTQLRQAIEHENVTMLIWLGKCILGQSEQKAVAPTDSAPDGIDFDVVTND